MVECRFLYMDVFQFSLHAVTHNELTRGSGSGLLVGDGDDAININRGLGTCSEVKTIDVFSWTRVNRQCVKYKMLNISHACDVYRDPLVLLMITCTSGSASRQSRKRVLPRDALLRHRLHFW